MGKMKYSIHKGDERYEKILMRFIYWILMEEAKITVNTTCFGPYYQGKIDKQLDILKKYNEK